MKIKLLKPHEHAGRTYPVDSELDLRDDDAKWLIAIKVAEAVAETKSATKPSTTKEKSA